MKAKVLILLSIIIFSCSSKKYGKSKDYIRNEKVSFIYNLKDSNNFIDGKCFYTLNNQLIQVEAINGYILSYSKKILDKDSNIKYWVGEAYIQNYPLQYKSKYLEIETIVEKPRFFIKYRKNGERKYGEFYLEGNANFTYNYLAVIINYNWNGKKKLIKYKNNEVDTTFRYRNNLKPSASIKINNKSKIHDSYNFEIKFSDYEDSSLVKMIGMPNVKKLNQPEIISIDTL